MADPVPEERRVPVASRRPRTRARAPRGGRRPPPDRRRGAGGRCARAAPGCPASPRGPAPSRIRMSTVSAWSSAVWPSAIRRAPVRRATRPSAACRSDTGRRLGRPPGAARHLDPDDVDGTAEAPAQGLDEGGVPVSLRAEAVVDVARPRAGARSSDRRRTSACRRATESGPPETATRTWSPGSRSPCRPTAARTAAARRDGAASVAGLSSAIAAVPPGRRRLALEPHPGGSILEQLALPDRHEALHRVDRVLAGLEGLLAVGGRHADRDARLADGEPADPVEDDHLPDRRASAA